MSYNDVLQNLQSLKLSPSATNKLDTYESFSSITCLLTFSFSIAFVFCTILAFIFTLTDMSTDNIIICFGLLFFSIVTVVVFFIEIKRRYYLKRSYIYIRSIFKENVQNVEEMYSKVPVKLFLFVNKGRRLEVIEKDILKLISQRYLLVD